MNVVETKSAWLSKTVWTQIISFAAMVLTLIGIDMPMETQVHIMAAIVAGTNVVTWIMRTWFTSTVTPSVAAKL